jgi:hypothetical protein
MDQISLILQMDQTSIIQLQMDQTSFVQLHMNQIYFISPNIKLQLDSKCGFGARPHNSIGSWGEICFRELNNNIR